MKTPDKIYLLDMGDEVVWCDTPDPGNGMTADDAVEYIKKPQVSPSNSNDWLCTIPYKFMKDGYVWSLLSVKNDFSKPESETFVHGEYENQYGHTKQFSLKEFRA